MAAKYNEYTKRFVYVLALTGGKYYVGSAADLSLRISQHRNGRSSAYVKRHGIEDVVFSCAIKGTAASITKHERRLTLRLAANYGFDNVRGARFTNSKETPLTWHGHLEGVAPISIEALNKAASIAA